MADDRRTALIVGGGRGIGRAIAADMARRGYQVIVAARTKSELEQTVAAIKQAGGSAHAETLDIENDESVRLAFARIRMLSDSLHVLVNCAGKAAKGSIEATPPALFDAIINVNLNGTYRCIYHAAPLLRRASGQIINIASRAGRQVYADTFAYGTSKAAVCYLTRALASMLTPVRVNAISPGAVATRMRTEIFPLEDPARLTAPASVAAVTAWLVEFAPSSINGAVIDAPW